MSAPVDQMLVRRTALAIAAIAGGVPYAALLLATPAGGGLVVAAVAILVWRASRDATRARRKRKLWARFREAAAAERPAVLAELEEDVVRDDHDRLSELSVDADLEVRRIATRLLHRTLPPPPRLPPNRGARRFWMIAGCLLFAVGAWRMPEFSPIEKGWAAGIVAMAVLWPAWACVPVLPWLLWTGWLFLLDSWFSPPGSMYPGWTESLAGGLIVFLVSLRERPGVGVHAAHTPAETSDDPDAAN
jgi:hypothetical protein